MSDEKTSSEQQPPEVVHFHFIKGSQFRVIHADGAFGGISPRGYIQFTLYNERQAIPRITERTLEKSEGGTATYGTEKPIEVREGFVRELEVGVIMDITTAKELHAWLGGKIGEWNAAAPRMKWGSSND